MPSPSATSSFSLSLIGAAVFLASCGGDPETCGPAEGAQAALNTSIGSLPVTWSNWQSSPNNDCGETDGPTSLTVEAEDDSGLALVLCVPRPDTVNGTVGLDDASSIVVVDIFAGDGADCVASLDRTMTLAGSATFEGVCDDGLDPAGYSITFDAQVPMSLDCGEGATSQTMALRGTVSVATE